MRLFSGWRPALRIARREVWRSKGRSLLIVAMILLPVLGMVAADVTYRSGQLDTDERIARDMGRADAVLETGFDGDAVLQSPSGAEIMQARYANGYPNGPSEQPPQEPKPRPTVDQLRASIPGVTDSITQQSMVTMVSTAHGRAMVSFQEFDYGHPLAAGMYAQRKGRAPRTTGEVAVTEEFRKNGGYKVGDTLTAIDSGKKFTIVGTVDNPDALRAEEVLGLPGALSAQLPGGKLTDRGTVLVKTPTAVTWAQVKKANEQGAVVKSREVRLHPPARADVPLFQSRGYLEGSSLLSGRTLKLVAFVIGLGLLEMVLLAGPAFAVGARRRRRDLGLVTVAGGNSRHVGSIVLADGVVLGFIAGVAGIGLGVLTAVLGRPWFTEKAGKMMGRVDIRPLELLGIALVGVVVGVLAALLPAVMAARENVLTSLTGRRGVRRGSRVLPILGALTALAGAGAAYYGAVSAKNQDIMLVGIIVGELGLVACCPVLVGMAGRLGRFLPLGPRLALRDAARNRPRTAPAVAAIMAAVAGATAATVYMAGNEQADRNQYLAQAPSGQLLIRGSGHPGPSGDAGSVNAGEVTAAVSAQLPGVEALVLRAEKQNCTNANSPDGGPYLMCASHGVNLPEQNRCPLWTGGGSPDAAARKKYRDDPRCTYESIMGSFGDVLIGDRKTVTRLSGGDDPRIDQVFAEGGVVVFDPNYIVDGKAEIIVPGPPVDRMSDQAPEMKTVKVPALFVDAPVRLGTTVFGEVAARNLGIQTVDAGVVYAPDKAPSPAVVQKIAAQLPNLSVYVERGFQGDPDLLLLLLAVFAALIALGASGVATGLALADSQRDLDTLGAVGAPPTVRRTFSAFQSAVVALLGTALGVVAGVVTSVVIRWGQRETMAEDFGMVVDKMVPVVIPWGTLGLALVGLPLLAALLAGALTRSKTVHRGRTG
jgi:putative ABC transport system permease protein